MIVQEYVGFQYEIVEKSPGHWVAVPLPGQHPAANKEKHRRQALQDYFEK